MMPPIQPDLFEEISKKEIQKVVEAPPQNVIFFSKAVEKKQKKEINFFISEILKVAKDY